MRNHLPSKVTVSSLHMRLMTATASVNCCARCPMVGERKAVGRVFLFEPAGAQAELESSLR